MKIGKTALAFLAMFAVAGAQASPPSLATLPLGNNTQGIALDTPLAKAFVTNFNDGTVSVVDMNSLVVTATIPVGSNPRRIISNAATHFLYLVNDSVPGTVTVINAATNAIVASIPVGNNPRAITSNFLIGEVYVSNNGGNTVSVINTATNTVVSTIVVGSAPGAPTSNDNIDKLYVPSFSDNTVSVINEHSHLVIKTIPVGKGPILGAIDPLHNKVYVNNATDKTISIISSATDTVTATLPSGAGGTGTTANFAVGSALYHRMYLPNAADNTLTIINTDTDTVVHTVSVGTTPIDAIVDSSGGNVYVVNQGSSSVSILNAATEAVVDFLPIGGAPWRVADGLDHVFVLNTNGSTPDSVTISREEDTIPGTAIATEFYDAAFDHYFHTADDIETRLMVDGVFGDNWHRTLTFWRVWTASAPGRFPVCRFFSTAFGAKSSHFYSPYPTECSALQTDPSLSSTWQKESLAVYFMSIPDASGTCPGGTSPLYRIYNNGMGGAPNHRYVADRALRAQMLAAGWVAEGSGPDVVFACTPTLLNG